jgi:hypothetical protein
MCDLLCKRHKRGFGRALLIIIQFAVHQLFKFNLTRVNTQVGLRFVVYYLNKLGFVPRLPVWALTLQDKAQACMLSLYSLTRRYAGGVHHHQHKFGKEGDREIVMHHT